MTTPKRGRPPYQPNPRKMVSCRLDPQVVAYLATVPNKTETIESLIKQSAEYQRWAKRRRPSADR